MEAIPSEGQQKQLSSKITSLKFMQRSQIKEEREKAANAQKQELDEAHWVLETDYTKELKPKFQIDYEPSYLPFLRTKPNFRRSFTPNGAPPFIDSALLRAFNPVFIKERTNKIHEFSQKNLDNSQMENAIRAPELSNEERTARLQQEFCERLRALDVEEHLRDDTAKVGFISYADTQSDGNEWVTFPTRKISSSIIDQSVPRDPEEASKKLKRDREVGVTVQSSINKQDNPKKSKTNVGKVRKSKKSVTLYEMEFKTKSTVRKRRRLNQT
ncbi:hypothetical protein G9A89_000869 [Geosiphon pyriformis]|nr:hypothetical protein G9A89_001397 [Geosiphon pyriformis]KAG9302721.1 hypothetical protein G9A89_000869 [Geosiphon pyriformis]